MIEGRLSPKWNFYGIEVLIKIIYFFFISADVFLSTRGHIYIALNYNECQLRVYIVMFAKNIT